MNGAIVFQPLIPWPAVALLAAVAFGAIAWAARGNARGMVLRALSIAVLTLAILDPRVVNEQREATPDVALVVVDRSASQSVGDRRQQTESALAALRAEMSRFENLEMRVIAVADEDEGEPGVGREGGTRLVGALTRALADVPKQRFAGAVLITDGQIHDVPEGEEAPNVGAPVHALLTGRRGERDRRLVVERAPGFGIVGRQVSVVYRVEDRDAEASAVTGRRAARVTIRHDEGEAASAVVPVGESQEYTLTLDHAGPTLVTIEVEAAEGELSTVNNRALVSINGVRDRLRVLLVSGQPHAGERTWRNLLKSDPAVDLVHFTILRPPEKDDFTPLVELALIAFPVQELFEVKLKEFDLIVFDRYVVRDVLPPSYLRNIEAYVREGGALLLAVGPEFAGIRSLFQTPLGVIMPGVPSGRVLEQGFRPLVTELGRRHPVTAGLPGGGEGAASSQAPQWGRWFRLIESQTRSGHTLMEGLDGRPLLILDRVGKGRVAQFMSDHIWLWARGFEGGGPQAELLRRLAHWLMKEPELEEEGLSARVRAGQLTIERRSLSPDPATVTVTAPSGKVETFTLTPAERPAVPGPTRLTIPADETGLYRVTDGTHQALAAAGALNPLEFSDLRATDERLKPLAEATGGGVFWLSDGIPDVRRTRPGRDSAGQGWLGLTKTDSYVITGVAQVSLLPGLLVLALVLGGLAGAWWREGR
jgi:hypothetical protein